MARKAHERRALLIVGLLHIWESNPSTSLICLVGVVEHPQDPTMPTAGLTMF